MQKINNKYIKSIVYHALREDLKPSGDITSKNINNKKVTAKIITGQNCIIGGLNFAKETFKILDCLENETNEILIPEIISRKARKAVERMVAIGGNN